MNTNNNNKKKRKINIAISKFKMLSIANYTSLVVLIICAIILFIAGFRVLGNLLYAKWYEKGNYKQQLEQVCTMDTLIDPYVVNYNLANGYYQQEEYEMAIFYYSKALSYDIPEYEECKIRINMALAMTKTIDFTSINSQYDLLQKGENIDKDAFAKEVKDAIKELQDARSVLTQDNCAGDQDTNGHSPEAEALKKDIDDEIEILKKMLEEAGGGSSDDEKQDQEQPQDQDTNDQQSQSQQTSDEKEESIKQKLDKEQKEALEQRQQEIDEIEEYSSYSSYEDMYHGKSW